MTRGAGASRASLALLVCLFVGAKPAPPAVLAFAALPDADESALLRIDAAGEGRELARVGHAAGFLPRGAVSRKGLVAAVVVPEGGDLVAPAELVTIDAQGTIRLLDDRARALQRPMFLGDGRLLSLRATPGPERQRADGRALLTTELASVLLWPLDAGAPAVVWTHDGLWLDLVAPTGDGFVALAVAQDGRSTLEERDLQGALRSRIDLGLLPVRDLAVVPGEDRAISFVSAGPTAASLVRADLRTGRLSIVASALPPDASGRVSLVGRALLSRWEGAARTSPSLLLSDGSVVWWTYGVGVVQRHDRDGTRLLADRPGVELSLLGEAP